MTKTIRSTTDEMLAARFDPEPWVDSDGSRSAYIGGETPGIYLPRPEYARPEPNPILVAMRRPHWVFSVNPAEWLAALDDQPLPDGTPHCWHHTQIVESDATPAQIEDARKVLTRIVGVFG